MREYLCLSVYRNSEELLLPYLSCPCCSPLSMCLMSTLAVADLHWTTSYWAIPPLLSKRISVVFVANLANPEEKAAASTQAPSTKNKLSTPPQSGIPRSRSHLVNTHLPRADLQERLPLQAMNDILTFQDVFTNTTNPSSDSYSCLFVHEAAQRHLTRLICFLVPRWYWFGAGVGLQCTNG